MKVHATPLSGLLLLETDSVRDERGRFVRVFCQDECASLRPGLRWSQINLSQTKSRGTIRGMHFQYQPAAEAKLIRCLRGSVFDVAVDVRSGSPTFLQWHAVELRQDQANQVFIPEGFAHGFQALSDDVELLYLHTAPWNRECEGRLRYDDPALAIAWPLPPTLVSERDREAPLVTSDFIGVRA